jgi:TolA-binding protein
MISIKGSKRSDLTNACDIDRNGTFTTMTHTLVYLSVLLWFFLPIASQSADNSSGLEKAQTETTEAIANVEKLYKQSGECHKKVADQYALLDFFENTISQLGRIRKRLSRERKELNTQMDIARQQPGSNDKTIKSIKRFISLDETAQEFLLLGMRRYVENGNSTDIDTRQKEIEKLESECRELLNQYVDAKENLEQLRKRVENLASSRCDKLLGEFKAAADPTNPSKAGMVGILARAGDCPWYEDVIQSLLNFKYQDEAAGNKDQEKQQEPTPHSPPAPPGDDGDGQVAEGPEKPNEYFEEVGEDDSAPEPPPSPPVEDQVAEEPEKPNEYFEEVGESEVGSTTDNSYNQSDNPCSSLLAQFNAMYNIEQMRAILQQAQNCSWYGAGIAALQNQIDYYKEQNQRQQQYQQQQAVRPGTVTILPNPFPNPYAKPPAPESWRPNQRPGATDFTHFDWQKAAEKSRTNPPPKNQQRPVAPPKQNPPKSKPPPDQKSGNGLDEYYKPPPNLEEKTINIGENIEKNDISRREQIRREKALQKERRKEKK